MTDLIERCRRIRMSLRYLAIRLIMSDSPEVDGFANYLSRDQMLTHYKRMYLRTINDSPLLTIEEKLAILVELDQTQYARYVYKGSEITADIARTLDLSNIDVAQGLSLNTRIGSDAYHVLRSRGFREFSLIVEHIECAISGEKITITPEALLDGEGHRFEQCVSVKECTRNLPPPWDVPGYARMHPQEATELYAALSYADATELQRFFADHEGQDYFWYRIIGNRNTPIRWVTKRIEDQCLYAGADGTMDMIDFQYPIVAPIEWWQEQLRKQTMLGEKKLADVVRIRMMVSNDVPLPMILRMFPSWAENQISTIRIAYRQYYAYCIQRLARVIAVHWHDKTAVPGGRHYHETLMSVSAA